MKNFKFPILNFKKGSRGFTIVESLVAITILIVVISGAMTAIQTSLSSYIISKDQFIAFYLAQEGFEQIRNIRDQNIINGDPWLKGITNDSGDPCYYGKKCKVEPVIKSYAEDCMGNCGPLKQDTSSGFYGYNSSWSETVYTREIILEYINDNEISILVTVDWSKGSLVNRQFRVRENILNWSGT